MKYPRSPLAPRSPASPKPVRGMRLAMLKSGIRYKGRDDLLLAEFDPGASVAGVFTQTLAIAAPVTWCRKALKNGKARALLVNAGNANAVTGKAGDAIVQMSVQAVSRALSCKPVSVFVASTGIVGQPMAKNSLAEKVPPVAARLGAASAKSLVKASRAIMTTDTFPKWVSRTARIGGRKVTITGIAKGSGMIAPNMATLLAFVFTDAAIPSAILQKLLNEGTAKSFNCTTVDGDTSTNDTLLVFATGAAKNKKLAGASLNAFRKALEEVLIELAQLVVRDGEGAQKFITIDVRGAASDAAARRMGLTIANSPLVKTAIAGEDANWGRILAAAGRSGEKININKAGVAIGGIAICKNGQLLKHYDERPVARHLKGRDIYILVAASTGKGRARVWTCDLTHGYIDINASYRS